MGVRAAEAKMHFFQKKVIMTVKKQGMHTSVFKSLKGCTLFFQKQAKRVGVSEGESIKA